jgi:micrococcal nuclease
MDKKYAFILASLILALVLLNYFSLTTFLTKEQSREKAVVSRIIDGDTLELSDGRTIRLLNINAPEKGTHGANLSAEFLREFENKTVELEITGTDKYKRTLARIYSPEYINLNLVEQGLASKFLVQESELREFSKAEESAIKSSLGIWVKSPYFGCFDSEIDKINEEVLLINNCLELDINGWILKDESRKIYTFNNIKLEKVILHSGKGIDNLTDIFWQSGTDIWNNNRDSLYLFDSNGGIAEYESYGY